MDEENVQLQEASSIFADTKETERTMPVFGQLLILGVVLLGIFGTGYVPKFLAMLEPAENQASTVVPNTIQETELVAEFEDDVLDLFADFDIAGRAAFVWDVEAQKVLWHKNADEQLPLASVTKLMTALVAHELIEDDASIAIPASAIWQDGESGLRSGETFSLNTLSDLTLITSSNDGAFAIASAAGALLVDKDPATAFVQAMNIRADELGLTQTYFRNPTGLDISTSEAGAYGSARDIAFLLEYILVNYPSLLEATTETRATLYNETGEFHATENTNQYVNDIPGIIGSKTGYTTLAGGNLAIAFDASLNRPIVAVVLGSSYQGRFNDILSITNTITNATN